MDPSTQKNKTFKDRIVTNVAMEEVSFAEQRMNFQRSGMAIAPSGDVADELHWDIRRSGYNNLSTRNYVVPSVHDHT
jgi:hypothetical protein